jgi:DNA-binding CsgD family transcriptional regulator
MARGEERRVELTKDDEIVRLLAIQLRIQLGSQARTIAELSRAGFGPTRIAQLLGTTPNTVNVTLQKAKKTPKLEA